MGAADTVGAAANGGSSSSSGNRSNSTNHHDNDDNTTTNIEFVDYVDESKLHYVTKLVQQDLSEPYSVFTYRYFLERFPDLCILAIDSTTKEPIGCVVGKIDSTTTTTTSTTSSSSSSNNINDNNNNGEESSSSQSTPQLTSEKQQQHHEAVQQQQQQTQTGNNNVTTVVNNTNTGYIGMLAVSSSYRRRGIGKALVRQVLERMKSTKKYNCTSVTLETEVTNTSAQQLYQNHFGFVREELLVRYYLNWNDAYRLRLWF